MAKRMTKKEIITAEVRQRKLEYVSYSRWAGLSECVKNLKLALKDEFFYLDKGYKLDERDEELLKAVENLISQVQEITDEGYRRYAEQHKGRHWTFSNLC